MSTSLVAWSLSLLDDNKLIEWHLSLLEMQNAGLDAAPLIEVIIAEYARRSMPPPDLGYLLDTIDEAEAARRAEQNPDPLEIEDLLSKDNREEAGQS